MTNVKIFKKNGRTIGFKISGHSGFAESGKDIVCASISSISQMCLVGLENVLGLNANVKSCDGFLECKIDKSLNAKLLEKVDLLFNTFEKSIELLLLSDKKIKKYIDLEVKDEIL